MIVTSSNVATAMTKLVAVDALPAIIGELVMGNLITRDFAPQVAQPGDEVKSIAEHVVPLTAYIESTFQIPDVIKVLAVPELLQLYMRPSTLALADKIESDLLSVRFTTTLAGSGLENAVNAADVALFKAGVSASSAKFMVTSADTYSELRGLPRFSEYQTAGEAGLRAMVDGPVGKIGGLYVLRSSVARKPLAFSKDSVLMAIRRLPQPPPGTGAISQYAEMGNFGIRVVMSYQPNTLAQQFTIGILYGFAVMNDSHGVEVPC